MEVARASCQNGHFDWSCFAGQQAAEKALKALYRHHHAGGWGNVLDRLVEGLLDAQPKLAEMREFARILDKFYIPTRYPNGLDAGAPADAYTETEAEMAIAYAEQIVQFCQTRCGSA